MNVQVLADPAGCCGSPRPWPALFMMCARPASTVSLTPSAGGESVPRQNPRALVEQAVAIFKSRRLLRKLRCSTTRITRLIQAVLTHLTSSDRCLKSLIGAIGMGANAPNKVQHG